MKIYKIRNKETGLFSKGGSNTLNIWSKTGKSWSNIGHLKNHLNLHCKYCWSEDPKKRSDYPYENAEIIELEFNFEECFKYDVEELSRQMLDNKIADFKDYQSKNEVWKRRKELEQLEELKRKYE